MAVHQVAYFCYWLKPLFWFRWCRLSAALMNGVFCSKFSHLKAIKVSFCPQIYSIYIETEHFSRFPAGFTITESSYNQPQFSTVQQLQDSSTLESQALSSSYHPPNLLHVSTAEVVSHHRHHRGSPEFSPTVHQRGPQISNL